MDQMLKLIQKNKSKKLSGEQEMNPKYQITIVWSQEDECYLVSIPDFADEIMQPVSHGNTYQEALQNGLEVMEELILNLQTLGKPLPINLQSIDKSLPIAKLMFSHYQEKPGLHVVLQKISLKFYEEASNSINLEQNDELEIEEAIKLGILVQKEEELSFKNLELLNEYLTHHIVNLILDNWNNIEIILKIHRKMIKLSSKILSKISLENQVLLLLNKQNSKSLVDLLIKVYKLKSSQEKQLFIMLYRAFCKILPKLEISVESVISLLDFIGIDFDKVSYAIYKGIEEFAAQDKDIAENLYSSLMSRNDKPCATLLCYVLVGISRSDFAEAHRRALTFCDREESILRRVGISVLGRLKYETDEARELLPITLNKLQILRTIFDPEISFVIVRSFEFLVKYTDEAKKTFTELVVDAEPLIWKNSLSSLFQLARDEYTQEWYKKALLKLIKTQKFTSEELGTLDYCIAQYVNNDPNFTVQLIELIAKNWNFNNKYGDKGLVESLYESIFALQKLYLINLNYFFTNWIASKHQYLHLLAFELNSNFNSILVKVDDTIERNKDPILALRKEVLDTLDETTTICVLLRIVGYVINTQSLCKLLLSALAKEPISQEIIDLVTDLLVNYVLFNYPGEATDYLNARRQIESITKVERDVIDQALSTSKEYLDNRNKLPPLKEFQASIQKTYLYRLAKWKQQNEIREAGEAKSIFRFIMPERLFLYGKAVSSEQKGEITQPTPLIPMSTSYEIPQGELIDPLGQAWSRIHWQQIGLELTEQKSEL